MSTYAFDDGSGVVRLEGTLNAPGATVGDVLTVQADRSVTPSPGGGSQPLGVKDPCAVATWDDITLSGLQTIDFYDVQEGDRVLVTAQTFQPDNGIYVASAGAWTRATDADAVGDLVNGALVLAVSGNASGNGLFVLGIGVASWTPGTDAVVCQMIAGGKIATGASLDSGNSLDVSFAGTGGPVNVNGAQLKTVADPTDPQDAATKAYVDGP